MGTISRSIYGPKYTNNDRKIRTNEEIINTFNSPEIVSTIRSKTELLGHMQRMERDRAVKRTFGR
jgi:hypothetical protein